MTDDGMTTDGVVTDGVVTDGVATDGVAMEGVVTGGGVATDGVVADGVRTDGVGIVGMGTGEGVTTDGVVAGGVVVTGAARGIGAAIARRFAAEGARVVGVDADGDALAATMDELPGALGVTGDVRDEDVLDSACALAADSGPLRTFVANAGITAPGASLDYPAAEWDRLMSVHASAAFLGARTAARRMAAGASVVMISSVSGHLGFAERAAYCAAKAAVQGLVRALAVEWAPRGIRVNAVAPGTVATQLQADMVRRGYASTELLLSRVPMGRSGRPEEIADAVHYLSSDRASYITGVVLPVDGGWLAYGLPALS